MRCAFVLAIVFLLVLAACVKPECAGAKDCTEKSQDAFLSSCVEGKCLYAPIANVCGNEKCDASEDKNNCAQDCGSCKGKVPGTQWLEYSLVENKCVEAAIEPKEVQLASDASSAGDKFHVETTYNQPFNLKKDLFDFVIRLEQSLQNKDARIADVELSGTTKDKKKIVLGRKDINRQIWKSVPFEESLIIDFPAQRESELATLILKVRYEYAQGARSERKESAVQINYKDQFLVVNPASEYPCPASCDDKNPGTKDRCGVNNFCVHDPIPGACGNGVCDSTENSCTCVTDCGACSGGGSFTQASCKGGQCVSQLRSNVAVTPNNIFETRDLGPVELNINYKFNAPLEAEKDKLVIDVQQYRADAGFSKLTLKTIRLLEGSQVISESKVDKEIGQAPVTLTINIPKQAIAEDEKTLAVGVWYLYVQNEKEHEGMFQKQLGKVVLVSSG
ncbi:MAG TPA: hypothetical protein VJJ82_00350 [Candidatus Nanoarchaeia archaeon]|nr:hypothetical protein [Candidatus Nanoarchaeia archaeon]